MFFWDSLAFSMIQNGCVGSGERKRSTFYVEKQREESDRLFGRVCREASEKRPEGGPGVCWEHSRKKKQEELRPWGSGEAEHWVAWGVGLERELAPLGIVRTALTLLGPEVSSVERGPRREQEWGPQRWARMWVRGKPFPRFHLEHKVTWRLCVLSQRRSPCGRLVNLEFRLMNLKGL